MTRRGFAKTLFAGVSSISMAPALAGADDGKGFAFVMLGDLHFDRLEHHDLEWLQRDKPDDLRQVREYTQFTVQRMPRLFETVRQRIDELNGMSPGRAACVVQVGDLVEGLCGSEELALRQDKEAVAFVCQAKLGVPFLFAKGNHDITGPGAPEAFGRVFQPFIAEQAAQVGRGVSGGKPVGACCTVEHRDALFCFFDAYHNESLGWLEAALAKRTARHCFIVLHPPVVPYGARATWHLYSSARQQTQRERLLELLGHHHAFVLSGHIHKYNLLVRTTAGGGRFLQLAISSAILSANVKPRSVLAGIDKYNGDQVQVEPAFSPSTEPQRRAVYDAEARWVRQFEYADLPGYAVLSVNQERVTAELQPGYSRQVWRSLELTKLLES